MDPAIQLLYREPILLDESAPRTVRSRIAALSPLLGEATQDIQLAASELATAFLRYGGAKGFEFRLFAGDDRFRVEMVDSLMSEQNLTSPADEGNVRRRILDSVTDRWGVLGDGISVVWFEVRRDAAEGEVRREMT